ncbi:hypothetical protein Stsp01_17820 [Streptomyces sp. NBRC 13847]|nr:hypothetical protein Stsp01_17820 [Streptomyces sp. NBRC 13847]
MTLRYRTRVCGITATPRHFAAERHRTGIGETAARAAAVRWRAARTPVPGISCVRDIENPGSPMHESAHFISRRTLFGFGGFPIPDSCADYPPHKDILADLRTFAEAYGLTEWGSWGRVPAHGRLSQRGRIEGPAGADRRRRKLRGRYRL